MYNKQKTRVKIVTINFVFSYIICKEQMIGQVLVFKNFSRLIDNKFLI